MMFSKKRSVQEKTYKSVRFLFVCLIISTCLNNFSLKAFSKKYPLAVAASLLVSATAGTSNIFLRKWIHEYKKDVERARYKKGVTEEEISFLEKKLAKAKALGKALSWVSALGAVVAIPASLVAISQAANFYSLMKYDVVNREFPTELLKEKEFGDYFTITEGGTQRLLSDDEVRKKYAKDPFLVSVKRDSKTLSENGVLTHLIESKKTPSVIRRGWLWVAKKQRQFIIDHRKTMLKRIDDLYAGQDTDDQIDALEVSYYMRYEKEKSGLMRVLKSWFEDTKEIATLLNKAIDQILEKQTLKMSDYNYIMKDEEEKSKEFKDDISKILAEHGLVLSKQNLKKAIQKEIDKLQAECNTLDHFLNLT